MTRRVSGRLAILGALWGLVLAVVPALVMTEPYRLTSLLLAALLCAALSGAVGTLAAGRRAVRRTRSESSGQSKMLTGIRLGASQGLVGGGVAALLSWVLMALTISGFTLQNPVELSVLMSPRVFIGSFFVALSVFVYALVGSLLLGPVFGTFVDRIVRASKDIGGEADRKEDLVVR